MNDTEEGRKSPIVINTKELLHELSELEKVEVEGDKVGQCLNENTGQKPEVRENKGDYDGNDNRTDRDETAKDKEQDVSNDVQAKTLGSSHRISMNTRSKARNSVM